MRIGELARAADVPASTIRYYERIGLLPAPSRRHRQRSYAPDAIARLRLIRRIQAIGFRLAELRSLFGQRGELGGWSALAQLKLSELDQKITELRRSRRRLSAALDCDCGGDLSVCRL